MRKVLPFVLGLLLIFAIWQLPAWDQGVEHVDPDELPRAAPPLPPGGGGQLPAGHPPIDGSAGAPSMGGAAPMSMGNGAPNAPVPAVDPATLPLTPTGLGSQKELGRALPKLSEGAERDRFANAFRLTFTTQRDARDYGRAKAELQEIVEAHPELAEAYRALAYCEFNLTMSFPRTISLYERAVELAPDYGEAHYALAFMLGATDPERGATHFARAMELGIDDERNLRDRFYQGVD